ncbi:L,D-transpeptidase [Sphingomonas sp. IC-11]|uniref:L,D-transpeptidase n=2 Tax=unclassified Sphingomonas TaxID=196159 RepID=UPI001E31ED27|nr:L,D-transpeptidase [Sphingomonas sp. IC-11]MCD2315385.1 L,D-transpeptidase [Sphingomonas sp. IC-11]
MSMRRFVPLFASAALALAAAAPAQIPAPIMEPGAIERLKPGQFFWAPQIAPTGPVTMIVSLKTQRAYVYRNGVPIGVSTISSGKPGHATPTGVFTILQKRVDHKSNLYNNAPMPYMQRLTWDGIALHAGSLPGYPASHGCVRLPLEFAKLLYGVTELGLTVVITNDALVPEVSPAANPMKAPDADLHASPTRYSWNPERAPTGPVSIIVSGRDKRIIVLRNGKQIGSATVVLDEPITATQAFTLRALDTEGPHWLRLPLPGGGLNATGELTTHDLTKGHVPDEFRSKLEAVLTPGTTMLVTRETLATSGTGNKLAVLVTDPE